MTARKIQFTEDERGLIRRKYLREASPDDFEELIARCEFHGLNPLLGEVYLTPRRNQRTGQVTYSFQIGIEGFRKKAEDTELYYGQDRPDWVEDANGRLISCEVKVYRKDIPRPFYGVAFLTEFQQRGEFWARMERTMLAKCAEAIAFRKAFPGCFQKIYVPEEMGSDAAVVPTTEEDEDEDSRPRPKRATQTEQLPSIEEITPPPPAVVTSPAFAAPEELARRESEYTARVGQAEAVDALKALLLEAKRKVSPEAFERIRLACTDKRLALERLQGEAGGGTGR